MTQTEQHTPDFSEYIRVLRARKYEVAAITALLMATTLVLSLRQTPIYEGRAKVLVKPIQTITGTVSLPQTPNLDTERELILSQAVAQDVKRDLSLPTPVDALLRNVTVEVVTDTEVLVIKYDDPNRSRAQLLANGFATAYVNFRSKQALKQIQTAEGAVQEQVVSVQAKVQTLRRQVDAATNIQDKDSLESQRESLLARLGVLQQRLLDLQSSESFAQSAADVIQPAELPKSPISPNLLRNMILAVLAGVALGIGFAFLRERLDDRVKSRQELERRLGVPVLAAVPRVNGWRRADEAHLIMRADPRNPVSEAYRTLATNIQYQASRDPLKVILITSSMGGEGKSTTAANLSVALAQAGKRVILVSADLRRPRTHHYFMLTNEIGLTNVLQDGISLSQVARDPGVANLRVINAGPSPADPAVLLGSRRAREFLEALRAAADVVVIDSPPVLAVADASILAPMVDGTVFVTDMEHSRRSALIQSRDQLENAGARIIGAVYNNFDPSSSAAYPYYYYNYYYQYYGDDGASNGRRGGRGRKSARNLTRRTRAAHTDGGFPPTGSNGGVGAEERPGVRRS